MIDSILSARPWGGAQVQSLTPTPPKHFGAIQHHRAGLQQGNSVLKP